jgi:hypothetical protein
MLETQYRAELLRDGVQLMLEVFRRSPAYVVLGDGLARMHAAEITELLKRSGKSVPPIVWVGPHSDAFNPGFAPDHQVDDAELLTGLGQVLNISVRERPLSEAPPSAPPESAAPREPEPSPVRIQEPVGDRAVSAIAADLPSDEPRHAQVPRHALPRREWNRPERAELPPQSLAGPLGASADDSADNALDESANSVDQSAGWKPDVRSLESFEAELGEPAPPRPPGERPVPPIARPPRALAGEAPSPSVASPPMGDSFSDDELSFSDLGDTSDEPDFSGSFGGDPADSNPFAPRSFRDDLGDDDFAAPQPTPSLRRRPGEVTPSLRRRPGEVTPSLRRRPGEVTPLRRSLRATTAPSRRRPPLAPARRIRGTTTFLR